MCRQVVFASPARRLVRGMPISPPMPAGAAAAVTALGRNPERMIDVVVLSRDGIALHELGHRFTSQCGLRGGVSAR